MEMFITALFLLMKTGNNLHAFLQWTGSINCAKSIGWDALRLFNGYADLYLDVQNVCNIPSEELFFNTHPLIRQQMSHSEKFYPDWEPSPSSHLVWHCWAQQAAPRTPLATVFFFLLCLSTFPLLMVSRFQGNKYLHTHFQDSCPEYQARVSTKFFFGNWF